MERLCEEPVNGQFEDCSKDVLPAVDVESSSSEEEDVAIASEQIKHDFVNLFMLINSSFLHFSYY